jgi:hypothetical protein
LDKSFEKNMSKKTTKRIIESILNGIIF